MSDEDKKEKCPNCGYKLKYDAKKKALFCEACRGTFLVDFKHTDLEEKELDYDEVMKNVKFNTSNKKVEVTRCQECGAMVNFDKNRISLTCPYCGSNKAIKENIHASFMPVAGIIPFNFDQNDALDVFKNWIAKKKFAPQALKKHYLNPVFYPIYIPYYTFDAKTNTVYRGERGTYYYVTVTHTRSDGTTYSERERRTSWTSVSGRVRRNFDDMLVIASSIDSSNKYIKKISAFNVKKGQDFDTSFLLGYYAQTANIDPENGFKVAKKSMERVIYYDIENSIGGDDQRVNYSKTEYSNVTCKQIMMPVFNGVYKYNGKTYTFALNGQTKQFAGAAPVSIFKILLIIFIPFITVLLIIILITLIVNV